MNYTEEIIEDSNGTDIVEMESTESTENIESIESIESVESVENAESTESIESAESVESVEMSLLESASNELLLGGTSVPLADTTIGTAVMTEIIDMTEVVETLDKTNFTLSAILFVILCSLCIQKIESGVRRLFKTNG